MTFEREYRIASNGLRFRVEVRNEYRPLVFFGKKKWTPWRVVGSGGLISREFIFSDQRDAGMALDRLRKHCPWTAVDGTEVRA